MKTSHAYVATALLAGVFSTFHSGAAQAGCGTLDVNQRSPLGASFLDFGTSGASSALMRANTASSHSIVGLWKSPFSVKGPDGKEIVIDAGYTTWHSDGTELMNSGSRPPPSGDFCMGAYALVAPDTYKLNHFAISWDDTGANFVGEANIKERVTLDSTGDRYSGTFVLNQYDVDGNVLAHAEGKVRGRRVTAN